MAPVSQRVQIAQNQLVLQAKLDARQPARDFPSDEGLAPDRAFVIEQYAVAREQSVRFSIVDRYPMRVELGGAVRAARIERRRFGLRMLLHQSEQLRCRRLIESGFFRKSEYADGFKQSQRSERIGVRGVFGLLEGCHDMALSRKVVDLVRPNLLHDMRQARAVRHVAVMQRERSGASGLAFEKMVDARSVEERGPALYAVNPITFLQQEFRQVGAVLPGDACNQCGSLFHCSSSSCRLRAARAGFPVRREKTGALVVATGFKAIVNWSRSRTRQREIASPSSACRGGISRIRIFGKAIRAILEVADPHCAA